MVERKRPGVFQARMLDEELKMLGELADREGVSASEWFRNTIRREHLLTFRSAKPRAKPKRK